MPKKVRKRIVIRKYHTTKRAGKRSRGAQRHNAEQASATEEGVSCNSYANAEVSKQAGIVLPLNSLIQMVRDSIKDSKNAQRVEKYRRAKILTAVIQEPVPEPAISQTHGLSSSSRKSGEV